MIDHTKVRLGKRQRRIDTRTLKMAKYLTGLPGAPPSVNWLKAATVEGGWSHPDLAVVWPMYGNDTLGDCVEAASGHMIDLWQSWTAWADPQPTLVQIIAAYSGATGYNPAIPSSDQGTDMISFLNYWRNTGVAGHKIGGYVELEPGNLTHLHLATYLFGAAMIGVQLPITAQSQPTGWSVPGELTGNGAPGSWGGHCIPVAAYNETRPAANRNQIITWGEVITMSDYFYQCYCDEAYAVLSADWIAANQQAPNNFNLAALQADLAAL